MDRVGQPTPRDEGFCYCLTYNLCGRDVDIRIPIGKCHSGPWFPVAVISTRSVLQKCFLHLSDQRCGTELVHPYLSQLPRGFRCLLSFPFPETTSPFRREAQSPRACCSYSLSSPCSQDAMTWPGDERPRQVVLVGTSRAGAEASDGSRSGVG